MPANPPLIAIVFWGLVTFSLLVVIHEGGHFAAARAFGVRVREFMLGLPGPSIGFTSKRTGVRYGVTAIPLGGYVRIAGMEPGEEDELLGPALKAAAAIGTIDVDSLAEILLVPVDRAAAILRTLEDWGSVETAAGSPDRYHAVVTADETTDPAELLATERRATYRGLPTWKRLTVLAMGVVMNLVTAVLIATVTLAVFGYPQPTLTLASVVKGSPAARAGMAAGDRLAALDGKAVKDWQQMFDRIQAARPGTVHSVTFVHAGRTATAIVTFAAAPQTKKAFLGVGPTIETVRPSVIDALGQSLSWIGLVFVAVVQFFNPSTFAASVAGARSVVGISVETARAASEGVLPYVQIVALLSLSLGVINILPIPPLDGGKIAMEIIEKVIRRPIPRSITLGISVTGALLLFSLIGYLMYADVVRYVAGHG